MKRRLVSLLLIVVLLLGSLATTAGAFRYQVKIDADLIESEEHALLLGAIIAGTGVAIY